MRARTFASALGIPALLCLAACTSTISLGTGDATTSSGGAVEPTGDPSLCLAGPITTIAENQNPTNLVLDPDYVYWIDNPGIRQEHEYEPEHLMSAPRNGGTPITLAEGMSLGVPIVEGENIYWMGTSVADPSTFSLFTTDRTGGPITTLPLGAPNLDLVGVDGDRIYLANRNEGTLFSMPRTGGTLTELGSMAPNKGRLLMDAQSFYWASGDQAFSLPKAGGTPVVLTAALGGDVLLTLDDQNLYFAWKGGSAKTVALAKSGGSPTVIVSGAYPFAVDDHCIYDIPQVVGATVEDTNHTVVGAPTSGGVPAVMASGLTDVWALATDETGLYWSNAYAGRVMKMAR